ncbi:MAG TPA: VIT family protein [Povalibacter sp.]|nr:VIT family protein [Povalibacter sp.]
MRRAVSQQPAVYRRPHEHRSGRTSWLRAAVLGANDGILSTAGLLVGVASAAASRNELWIAGLAGLIAGAMSMAAGEYVSVSSQADAEKADLDIERRELAANPEGERRELAAIYVERGLDPDLASKVATQLTRHDALAAHARDEIGLTPTSQPRPVQAAFASAAAFTAGAFVPLLVSVTAPLHLVARVVAGTSLVALAILGAIAAAAGGATPLRGAVRVTFWGALAMAFTAAVGTLFGTNV